MNIAHKTLSTWLRPLLCIRACCLAASALAVQGVAATATSSGATGASAATGAVSAKVGDAARGGRLISQYQCGACHAIPGVAAARGREGPPLQAFGRRSYIAGRVPNTLHNLARWIERPSALVPSTTMPDMGVPPQDARDMAAWFWQQQN